MGLVIGKRGDTLKDIKAKTGAIIYIPKESDPGEDDRRLTVTGNPN